MNEVQTGAALVAAAPVFGPILLLLFGALIQLSRVYRADQLARISEQKEFREVLTKHIEKNAEVIKQNADAITSLSNTLQQQVTTMNALGTQFSELKTNILYMSRSSQRIPAQRPGDQG